MKTLVIGFLMLIVAVLLFLPANDLLVRFQSSLKILLNLSSFVNCCNQCALSQTAKRCLMPRSHQSLNMFKSCLVKVAEHSFQEPKPNYP